MTTYKLTYFDMVGGRAEPVRIAFHAAGIEFEDERIAFPEFMEMRGSTRFNSVPVLEIDGKVYQRILASGHLTGAMATGYIWDCEVSRRLFPTLGTSQGCGGRSPP